MTSEWQPIETAPRDGRTILLRQGKWAPVHARWKDGGWQFVEYRFPAKPNLWKEIAPAEGGGERRMSDLVETLCDTRYIGQEGMRKQAADEINRLQTMIAQLQSENAELAADLRATMEREKKAHAAVKRLRAEIKRLQAALNDAVAAYDDAIADRLCLSEY